MKRKRTSTEVFAILCPVCKVWIYSRAVHDFHSCLCGSVYIDGGFDYNRIGWNPKINPDDIVQRKMTIWTTKKELYDDWNTYQDKFGWVSNIMDGDAIKYLEHALSFKRKLEKINQKVLYEDKYVRIVGS